MNQTKNQWKRKIALKNHRTYIIATNFVREQFANTKAHFINLINTSSSIEGMISSCPTTFNSVFHPLFLLLYSTSRTNWRWWKCFLLMSTQKSFLSLRSVYRLTIKISTKGFSLVLGTVLDWFTFRPNYLFNWIFSSSSHTLAADVFVSYVFDLHCSAFIKPLVGFFRYATLEWFGSKLKFTFVLQIFNPNQIVMIDLRSIV